MASDFLGRSHGDASAGAPTILVVEDDEPIRLALRELLEAEGYAVSVAGDGLQAISVLADLLPLGPSLVITDLQMPGVDGYQLCAHLRGDPVTRRVPIVVLTAAHQIESVQGVADAVVRKPFDIDALLAVVVEYIRPTVPPRPSQVMMAADTLAVGGIESLILYVTGGSAACERAETALRGVIGRAGPAERPSLEVVDIVADGDRATRESITMTPTLVRNFADRRDVFLGDLSDAEVLQQFLARRP